MSALWPSAICRSRPHLEWLATKSGDRSPETKDEPTRGVDIGAKGEIQALINELATAGLGVLMISSELEELVEGSASVVVMRDGECVAQLQGKEISQNAIIHAMAEGAEDKSSEAQG